MNKLESLPIEILQHMVWGLGETWSPQDVLSLALTSKSLYYALLGEVGNENKHDVDQHKSLSGIVFCVQKRWWKPAVLAAQRGIGDANGVWDEGMWLRNMYPLRVAARERQPALVSVLLSTQNVDPSLNTSAPLRDAAERGHADVVDLLLADGRSDPAARDSYALTFAAHNGYPDVVALLLADQRVDPTQNNSACLRWAAENGHSHVVRLLLDDGRADPAACNNQAIIDAAGEGELDVVRALMDDDRVDPSAQRNAAVRRAFKIQRMDVVEILSADPRVEVPEWADVEHGVDGWTGGGGCDCGAV